MVHKGCASYMRLSMKLYGKYVIKRKAVNYMDSLRIYCRGGKGGNGLPTLGGIGGKGGSVYIVGGSDELKLQDVLEKNPNKRYMAGNGGAAQVHMLQGEAGDNVEVYVPLGVSVVTDSGKVLEDINTQGQCYRVAKGGRGASSRNGFQPETGERVQVKLDLKLIADIGLLGFPNAGKSTLLNSISRASPRIASYPFTTLHPNVGMMVYEDNRQISMADLPGLIEGAHYNVGMGHKFLKHVERTKLLLYIVDIQGFQLSPHHPDRSALEMVVLLNKELELYKPELVNKPALLCVNKMDTENADALYSRLREDLECLELTGKHERISEGMLPQQLHKFDDVIEISAKHNVNIAALKERLRELLDIHADLNTDLSHQLDKIYADKYVKGFTFDVV